MFIFSCVDILFLAFTQHEILKKSIFYWFLYNDNYTWRKKKIRISGCWERGASNENGGVEKWYYLLQVYAYEIIIPLLYIPFFGSTFQKQEIFDLTEFLTIASDIVQNIMNVCFFLYKVLQFSFTLAQKYFSLLKRHSLIWIWIKY